MEEITSNNCSKWNSKNIQFLNESFQKIYNVEEKGKMYQKRISYYFQYLSFLSLFGYNLLNELINLVNQGLFPPKSFSYVLVPNVINQNEYRINVLQSITFMESIDNGWQNILDHNGSKDNCRKMLYLKDAFGNNLPTFLQEINIILKMIFYNHDVGEYAFLNSLPGLKIQGKHLDYFEGGSVNYFKDEDLPYAFVIALGDNIRLHVQESPTSENLVPITIPKYGMVLFAGNMWHAGDEYREESDLAHRIHGYIDSKDHRHSTTSQTFQNSLREKSFQNKIY